MMTDEQERHRIRDKARRDAGFTDELVNELFPEEPNRLQKKYGMKRIEIGTTDTESGRKAWEAAMAARNALPLRWTTARPTAPGWYWMRLYPDGRLRGLRL